MAGAQHLTADSTLNQQSPSWVAKLEYNRTFGNRGFLEVRAGEFGYNFGLVGNGQTDPRREDTTTLSVTGGGRDWQLDRRRKQLHGAYTFYVDRLVGGNHQFKVGGEVQHETGRTVWGSYYADNVVHVLQQRRGFVGPPGTAGRLLERPAQLRPVRQRQLPAEQTDRQHRAALRPLPRLPARAGAPCRAGSRPTPRSFAAVDDVKTFNHLVPRIGLIFDVAGNGRTLLKANYGRYFFNPGVTLADAVNPNTSTQYTQYAWTDRNGDRLWQDGEQGAIQAQFGGSASVEIDPDLRNSYTDEWSAWIERDLGASIGARAGFVWKMDRDGYQQFNRNRPLSAYNVPITVVDPGLDGTRGTGDDQNVSMMNLSAAALAAPVANFVTNPEGFEADYKNVEVALNKRFSNRWSAGTSFLYTWISEYGSSYNGSGAAGSTAGSQPQPVLELRQPGRVPVHRRRPRHLQRVHRLELQGSTGPTRPAGALRLTPVFRVQQGYPGGPRLQRHVDVRRHRRPGRELRHAAAPRGAHHRAPPRRRSRRSNFRAEKSFTLSGRVKLGILFDVYNVFNANPELNIRATTGRLAISESGANIPTFNTPVTILPPRIARISARLDW